ncbi:MAG: phage tail spike protein [Ruminococcus sp.]|nr:phage tail spike protein [Ruminococcus sp.]
MIKAFSATDKDFTKNGDIIIKATRAVVHKVDNGDYYLELECGLEYADYVKAENIIAVPTPDGYQAFRIGKDIETTGYKITAKCWHVFYDSENYLIADSYVVEKNCNDALVHLNTATDTESPFTVSSDVSTVDSFRCVRKSLAEAVGTVLERWGGHLVRDNYDLSIKTRIGNDNGVTIQYKKNLKEISVSENWSEVCTKCLPVGKDGYTLAELYLYAPTQYDIPYTKTVSFEQNIERDDYPSDQAYYNALREDLIAQCTAYLEVAQFPQINYTLSANIEKITDVGDIVEVFDERLGVSLTASVLSFDYDAISEKYILVEFGSIGASLSDLLGSVSSEITGALSSYTQDITAYLQEAVSIAVSEIWATLGSSYVIYNGDEIVVVDSLPAESATNVLKINEDGVSYSTNGVLGSFNTILTLDGEVDTDNLTLLGLTLSKISGGNLNVGGLNDADGSITIKDSTGTEIGSVDHNGLILDNTNVIDEIRAKSGDTLAESGRIVSGYIHNSSEILSFTVPSRKTLKDISSISVDVLKVNVAISGGGYLFTYTSGGYDILDDADLSVAVDNENDFITFSITSTNAFSVPDGSSVTVIVEDLSLDLT